MGRTETPSSPFPIITYRRSGTPPKYPIQINYRSQYHETEEHLDKNPPPREWESGTGAWLCCWCSSTTPPTATCQRLNDSTSSANSLDNGFCRMLVDLSLGGLGGASSALATPTAHRLAQLDRLDTGCRRGPLGTKPLAPSEAVRVLWPQTHKTRHQATLLSAICLWAASAASTIAGDRIADPNATLPVNQPIARHVCFRSPSEARFNMGNLISHRRPHTIIHTASLGPKSGQPQRGGPGSHRCSPQAWPGQSSCVAADARPLPWSPAPKPVQQRRPRRSASLTGRCRTM